jgi:hypothetical protein
MSNDKDRDNTGLTRREFAALGGAALLASLIPLACTTDDTGHTVGPTTTMKADGDIVSDSTEDLGGGVTRTTLVVAWKRLPPKGAATTQTMIRTVTPTPTGEVIEIDMSFDPALPFAVGTGSSKSAHMRYEFTHGPMRDAGMREDLLTISSVVDGVATKATKRVLRPIRPTGVAALSTREQFQRGLDLLNKHQQLPKGELPGTLRFVADVNPSEV